jgi:serine/threonine-protein kinase
MTTDSLAELVDALLAGGLLTEEQQRELAAGSPSLAQFADARALLNSLVERGWLSNFQADEVAAGRVQNLVLGQYVLLDRLGEGGMGHVFKARHRMMNRVVALKIIRPDRLLDRAAVQRFHREIHAVAQLSHPNIIIAHDANQVGDTYFLVMEYVIGVDLARTVRDMGPLPIGQACDFIRQAALGLQHAFERGLVHRDLKPSNLLVTWVRQASGLRQPPDAGESSGESSGFVPPAPQPVVKILDMGLALLQSPAGPDPVRTELTHSGTVMGTPDFMSPEQATNAHAVDIRSDLYSLGCTLYFLLAGQPPFPDGSVMDKLIKHKFAMPRPVESRRPEVSPRLAAVVRRLLAKRPDDRYQTPAELAATLEECVTEAGGCGGPLPRTLVTGPPTPSALPSASTVEPLAAQTEPALDADIADVAAGLLSAGVASAAVDAETQTYQGPVRPPVADLQSWSTAPSGLPAAIRDGPASSIPAEPVAPPRKGRLLRAAVLLLLCAILIGGGIKLASIWLPHPGDKDENKDDHQAVGNDRDSKRPEKQDGTTKEKVKDVSPRDQNTGRDKDSPGEKYPPVDPNKDREEIPPPMAVREGLPDTGLYAVDSKYTLKSACFSGNGDRVVVVAFNRKRKDDPYVVREYYLNPEKLVGENRARSYEYNGRTDGAPLQAMAFHAKSDQLAVGVLDDLFVNNQLQGTRNLVALWNFKTSDPPEILGVHGRPITCVAIHVDGDKPTLVLSASLDDTICMWDPVKTNREPVKVLSMPDTVNCLAISPDGKWALSGDDGGRVCLLDLNRQESADTFTGHRKLVTCVVFSRDGQRALSGSRDTNLRLWDLAGKKHGRPMEGHTAEVTCVVLSADGRYALSGSEDKTVRLWDVRSGKEIRRNDVLPLGEHKDTILAVAFSSDGLNAFSVGKDNVIKRWRLPELED